jgi:DNA-binding transcriptional ArsR family regulator
MRGWILFYEFILNKAPLKVLTLLTLHAHEALYEREICERTGLAAGTVNQVLRELRKAGIVTVTRKGKMNFYQAADSLPLLRQHRIWDNLLKAQPLVQVLKPYCSRIILFGSCAVGLDRAGSDFDLVLVSEEPKEKLRKLMGRDKNLSGIIKPVVYTLSEYASLGAGDPAFYQEIQKGVMLYEKGGEADGDEL